MDVTKFPKDERTERLLLKIRDPLRRLKQAHATATEARVQVVGKPKRPHHPEDQGVPSELLVLRDEALLCLHRQHGWTKIACANFMGVDRRTLRHFDNLSAEVGELTEEEAKDRAKQLQGEWESWASIWRTATEIRDELVIRLTGESSAYEDGGGAIPNADLARAAKMSSSLVAQIRRGSMNAWKKANPEIFRENRKARERGNRERVLAAIAAAADVENGTSAA